MLWLVGSDQQYYIKKKDETEYEVLKKVLAKSEYSIPGFDDISEIIVKFDKNITPEDLKKIQEGKAAVLSPLQPPINNFFVVKHLPNQFKIQTSQQAIYKENMNEILYQKFGLTISESNQTFDDLKGYSEPKEEILKALQLLNAGHIRKVLALFLGVSGAGKSYFAECLGGALNKKIIKLDMGILMEGDNPIGRLHEFFRFIQDYDDYVLLMDEIEKPANPDGEGATASMAKMYIGQLLTIFNDLNTENGYKIKDNPIIATANNIGVLLDKNPEFINRFSFRYFIDYPSKESALEIFDIYLKKCKIIGTTAKELFYTSDRLYKDSKPRELKDKDSCVYAPREIFFLIEHLLMASNNLVVDQEIIEKVIKRNAPQAEYAKYGVLRTIVNGMNGFSTVD